MVNLLTVTEPENSRAGTATQDCPFQYTLQAPSSYSKNHLLNIHYQSLHEDMKTSKEEPLPSKASQKEQQLQQQQCDKEDAQVEQKHSRQRTQLWAGKEVSAGRHRSEKARERVFWALNDSASIFYFPIEYVHLFFKILKPRGPQE